LKALVIDLITPIQIELPEEERVALLCNDAESFIADIGAELEAEDLQLGGPLEQLLDPLHHNLLLADYANFPPKEGIHCQRSDASAYQASLHSLHWRQVLKEEDHHAARELLEVIQVPSLLIDQLEKLLFAFHLLDVFEELLDLSGLLVLPFGHLFQLEELQDHVNPLPVLDLPPYF